MANGIVSKLGELTVTQEVHSGAAGNAPVAAITNAPYFCTYDVEGSKPAVSHPTPPIVEITVMCHPRALRRSAEYETRIATTKPTTHFDATR